MSPGAKNPFADITPIMFKCGAQFDCGFFVNQNYFEGKPNMPRHSCPNCGKGRVVVCDADREPLPDMVLDFETGSPRKKIKPPVV